MRNEHKPPSWDLAMRKSIVTRLGLVIGILSVSSSPSAAGYVGTTFLPACKINAASLEDEVVVVKLHEGTRGVSSVAPTGRQDALGIVDLDIRPGAKPLYLVLSSYHPVKWRLHGSTENVSRVVALGSTKEGADRVSVTGVARERIEFPKPDFSTYVQGVIREGKVQPVLGDFVAKACAPETYLFQYPASSSDKSAVIVRRMRPRQSALGAFMLGWKEVNWKDDRTNFTTVAPGVVPVKYLAQPTIIDRPDTGGNARVSIRPTRSP
jgi:hypothetical protein